MAIHKDDLVKLLNDLISTCRDRQEGYLKAGKGAHRSDLANTLAMYARQADGFVTELQDIVRRLGGQPAERGHGGGVLHRGWVDLEQRIRPKEDPTIVAECQRGEQETIKHYEHALDQDLPQDIRSVVERQLQEVQWTIEKLRSLESARRAG